MAATTPNIGIAATKEVHESELRVCSKWTFWWVTAFMWSPMKRKPVAFRLSAEQTCETNAARLLALFNNNTDGPTATRIVWTLCGGRLLLANILYIAAFAAGMCSTVYCLFKIIDTAAMHREAVIEIGRQLIYDFNHASSSDVDSVDIAQPDDDDNDQTNLDKLQSLYWLFATDFVVYLSVAAILRCAMQSILLREATILRAACVGALYRQTVQSSVRYGVQSHEIIVFLGENADALSDLVRSGALLVSRTVAICICAVIGAILIDVLVLWGTIVALLLAVILINYGRMHFSGKQRRESHRIWTEKCELVDDVVQMAKTTQLADSVRQTLASRFSAIVRQQMVALCRAELLRPTEPMSFVILILLAIVHLISWPFINAPETDMNMFSCVTIILMITLPTLLFEWNESLVSLILGLQVIDRTQMLIRKLAVETSSEPTTTRSDGNHLVLKNAKFEYESSPRHVDLNAGEQSILHIRKLELSANLPTIIGITGKIDCKLYSMIRALLDDRTPVSGRCNISTTPAFYPEKPYLLDEQSVWHNIVLGCPEWHEERYQQCLSVLGLDQSADFQTTVVEGLSASTWQKIALTRALYNEQQRLLILENPHTDSVLFAKFIDALKTSGRSAIVLSRNNDILSQCDLIHVLHDHELCEGRPYEDCAKDAVYQQCTFATRTATAVEPVGCLSSESLPSEIPTKLQKFSVKKSPFSAWLTFPFCAVHVTMEAIVAIYIGPGLVNKSGVHYAINYSTYVIYGLIVTAIVHIASVCYLQRRCRTYNIDWHEKVFGKMMGDMAAGCKAKCGPEVAQSILLDDYSTAQHWTIRDVYGNYVVCLTAIVLLKDASNVWPCVLTAFIPYICVSTYLGPTIAPMLDTLHKKRHRLSRFIINDLQNRLVIQSVGGVTQAQDRIFKLLDEYAAGEFVSKSSIVFARFWHEVGHYVFGFSMLLFSLSKFSTTSDIIIRTVFWMLLAGGYWNTSLESEVLVAMRNLRLMKVWAYIGDWK